MKNPDRHASTGFRSRLTVLLLAISLTATSVWAHLPHPIQTSGVVLVNDEETKCLVFKAGKDKKPFVLDWNNDTEFVRNGQPATLATLTNNTHVTLYYKRVSFQNPLLKKVIWEDAPPAE